MLRPSLMSLHTYNPARLLDTVRARLGLANDSALARRLNVAAPTLSRIRARQLPLRSSVLLSMHEASGISIRELRTLAGDLRDRW